MTYIKSKRSKCLLLGSYGPSSLKNRDTDPQIPSKTFRRRFLALPLIYLPSAIKQMPTSRPPHSTSITRHSTSTTITQKSKKMTNRVLRSETQHLQQLSTTIPDPSDPPADGTCLWWLLARELRVRVLKLAYGRDRDAPMKPIMGVDFLREHLGFFTTHHRRGKLPQLVSGTESFPR
jgi:hypothetical protein